MQRQAAAAQVLGRLVGVGHARRRAHGAPGDARSRAGRGPGGARRARRGRRWRRRRRPGRRCPSRRRRRRTARTRRGRGPASQLVQVRGARRPSPRSDLGELVRAWCRRRRRAPATPAVCTTARERRCPSAISAEQRGQRVAVGDVAGGDGHPDAAAPPVPRGSSAAPGASGPRRLVSTRCSAPVARPASGPHGRRARRCRR